MPLPVAINGSIALQTPQPLTKRAMIIRMSEETLDALAAYPVQPPLQFEFGDTPGIHIGSTFFPMRGVPESTQHELYLRSALASKINAPLKLYADIAGKFTVDRELNGKAESKVHQSTADAQKSKSGGRIRLLEAPPTLKPSIKVKSSAPPKKRKTAVSAPIAATVKRVPVRVKNEGSSAARGQSPPPPLPTSQSTSAVSPVMRAHMIHLLAKGSRTKEDVLTQVGGPDASESLRVQLNELLVTIAERERQNSKTTVPGQPPLYTLIPVSWKEVRPYEFAGLADEERRMMWLDARRALHSLGIPESDPAWDYVRTRPGSAITPTSKAGAGPKRAAGTVGAERKKTAASKALVEAKDEGIRPSQAARAREEAVPTPQSTKVTPKREEDDVASATRRLPAAAGRNAAREGAPSRSQAQGPSKNVGLTDTRAKRGESPKTNGRPGVPTSTQPSASRSRDPEREKLSNVTKRQREDESDLDREKGKPIPAPRPKKRKDNASDSEWDATDATGRVNAKKKKAREDYGDKDRVNGTGNPVKRRKVSGDDAPYKPGGGGSGTSKTRERERERERDRESDRGNDKSRDRDPLPALKRKRESDRASPEPSLPPRKSTVRERDARRRARESDRSLSPPRRIKHEPSPAPPILPQQREHSPLPRVTTTIKRRGSPSRDSVKREASPLPHRPRDHPRRDVHALPPRPSKRAAAAASPPPPPPPPPRSQPRARDRDRDRESSVNEASTTTRRRRSPIYTSSEEEHPSAPVRRNAPSSVTSSSSSRDAVAVRTSTHPLPPAAPYPKDREALQARYRKGYRNYIALYHQLLDERANIQDALDDIGHEGGSAHGDAGVEMMDEEGLRDLADRYAAWTRELEGIRQAYSAVAPNMDLTA